MECNSAGGSIGQWPAAKRPDLAQGLTPVSCTLHRTGSHTRAAVEHWMRIARKGWITEGGDDYGYFVVTAPGIDEAAR